MAADIVQYLLKKSKEALSSGVSASEADFDWKTFQKEESRLVETIANKHLATKRIAQENERHETLTEQLELALQQGREEPTVAEIRAVSQQGKIIYVVRSTVVR